MTCLPWWHTQFVGLTHAKIGSGCGISAGNVVCRPEGLRERAEQFVGRSVTLAAYTLARYIASEVGSGTPEEKVAVAEAAIQQSNGDVVGLLLYRQPVGHPNRGWYGPIQTPGLESAPYGRWASTAADPGIDDLLIAEFVLSGQSRNFSRGATTQLGMEHLRERAQEIVKANAEHRRYWVGPLPGVDHWHTFLLAKRSVVPGSYLGRQLLARGLAAVQSGRPDWSGLRVCPQVPLPVVGGLALAAGLGVAYATATYVYPTWKDKIAWP